MPTLTHCDVRGKDNVQLYAQTFGSEQPNNWSFDENWKLTNPDEENWALYADGKGQAVFKSGNWGQQPFNFTFKVLTLKDSL